MPDPGSASSSSTAAASSTQPDPCETTPARPTVQRSPDPPIGESPATPLPKRLRSVNVDDSDMVAAMGEVTEVCEEPQPDWEALASRKNVGSTWFIAPAWRADGTSGALARAQGVCLLVVAVGDCAQAFLQAPLLEKNVVWVTPPPEAEVKPGRLGPPRNESQGSAPRIGPERARSLCTQQCA